MLNGAEGQLTSAGPFFNEFKIKSEESSKGKSSIAFVDLIEQRQAAGNLLNITIAY